MRTILLISALFLAANSFSQSLTVNQILENIEKNERVATSEGTSRQTIITSNGSKRTLEMFSYSMDNNDKQLTVYTAPSRVKGDKILMLEDGDEIWFYTPKTDRVRHLASHARKQKVQGSDFSYEDMTCWDYQKDFVSKLLGEEKLNGVKTYKLELVPTETGPHYSKMMIWARTDKFALLRVDYYEDNDLLKRLINSDFMEAAGHWIAKSMKMKNLQDGGETTLETIDLKVNIDVDESMFSTNYLKRN
jgi:outer membrane lipoprotein-sorting protein